MTDIVDLESLAEEGASTPVEPASFAMDMLRKQAARFDQSLVRCFYCTGLGTDRKSKWSHLWGGACWICAGWGVVIRRKERLRGPLGPHPAQGLMHAASVVHSVPHA